MNDTYAVAIVIVLGGVLGAVGACAAALARIADVLERIAAGKRAVKVDVLR